MKQNVPDSKERLLQEAIQAIKPSEQTIQNTIHLALEENKKTIAPLTREQETYYKEIKRMKNRFVKNATIGIASAAVLAVCCIVGTQYHNAKDKAGITTIVSANKIVAIDPDSVAASAVNQENTTKLENYKPITKDQDEIFGIVKKASDSFLANKSYTAYRTTYDANVADANTCGTSRYDRTANLYEYVEARMEDASNTVITNGHVLDCTTGIFYMRHEDGNYYIDTDYTFDENGNFKSADFTDVETYLDKYGVEPSSGYCRVSTPEDAKTNYMEANPITSVSETVDRELGETTIDGTVYYVYTAVLEDGQVNKFFFDKDTYTLVYQINVSSASDSVDYCEYVEYYDYNATTTSTPINDVDPNATQENSALFQTLG